MQKFSQLFMMLLLASPALIYAQDTTSSASEEPLEAVDLSQFGDASDAKVFCTSKTQNQLPTKMVTLGYEANTAFKNNTTDEISSMGGIRGGLQVLAVSTNKLLLSIGANYWGAKVNTSAISTKLGNNQLYNNRMDMVGLNALIFKPLDKKHFIIAQLNTDASNVGTTNNFAFNSKGITVYGSAMYGWKKNDYRMMAVGISRTYRLGRPLFVPIFLYNKTFNNHWGVEMLLPARANLRYNINANNIAMAGFELEGQQYYMNPVTTAQPNWFLQRGEIKPRLALEKKLSGFVWLGAQLGYRVGYRYNIVNEYNGKEANEITINDWGGSPYFNIGVSFVTP